MTMGACSSAPQPSLRGLAPVNERVCWVSGEGGVVRRTTDGGASWTETVVAEAQGVDLRDIEAFDERTAIAMAITQPAQLLRTEDGGRTWSVVYRAEAADAFLDSMAFWPQGAIGDRRGVAFGDPIDGAFLWIETRDGGRSWEPLPVPLPAPLDGEGGFAASGTMVCAHGEGNLLIGTSQYARLFRRSGFGDTWSTAPSPLRAGLPATGVFSVAVHPERGAIAVGGQYDAPDDRRGTAAWSTDLATWRPASRGPGGYRSGVAWSPDGSLAVAVGPTGVDLSDDGGRTWTPRSGPGWHAVAFAADGSCWVSGSDGRAARLALP